MGQTELRNDGVLRSTPTTRKKCRKAKKRRTATQNSSGIHRVVLLMLVCMCIRALHEGQTRREAGAQSLRAS
jgi:hypothetical protein